MEGSLQRVGNQVRITAQLIEAESGFHLWSESFTRELTDIFSIQDEIALAIADRLQVTLSGDQQTQLVAEATENTEAHDAYLRGRYLWSQRSYESLRNAITEFQQGIALDPSYAEAYSGLADSYLLIDNYAETIGDVDYQTNLEQGLIAARRAVSLAPELGMAHASLGFGLWNVGEWENAEREFERAIEVNPGYATAHQWYGILLFSTGRASEGVSYAERATQLDPLSPVISLGLGNALLYAGRSEEAIEQYRETIELAPGFSNGWRHLGKRLLEIGEYDEGMEAWVSGMGLLNADLEAATPRIRRPSAIAKQVSCRRFPTWICVYESCSGCSPKLDKSTDTLSCLRGPTFERVHTDPRPGITSF